MYKKIQDFNYTLRIAKLYIAILPKYIYIIFASLLKNIIKQSPKLSYYGTKYCATPTAARAFLFPNELAIIFVAIFVDNCFNYVLASLFFFIIEPGTVNTSMTNNNR